MLSLASSSLTVSHCWLLAPTTPTLTTVGSAVGAELPAEPEPGLEPDTGLEPPPFPLSFPPQAVRARIRVRVKMTANIFFIGSSPYIWLGPSLGQEHRVQVLDEVLHAVADQNPVRAHILGVLGHAGAVVAQVQQMDLRELLA